MEQKISTIETKLTDIEKDMSNVKADVKILDKRQTILEAKQSENSNDIKELSKDLKEVTIQMRVQTEAQKVQTEAQQITNVNLKQLIDEMRASREKDTSEITQIKLELMKENKDQDIQREKDKTKLLLKVFGVIGFLATLGVAIWQVLK